MVSRVTVNHLPVMQVVSSSLTHPTIITEVPEIKRNLGNVPGYANWKSDET